MALFAKQDFTPPLLSRKWLSIKFRPNMLLRCRPNVIAILESGLMFREDSTTVEELMPSSEAMWLSAGGGQSGWMTSGERIMIVTSLVTLIAMAPPRVSLGWRSNLMRMCAYTGLAACTRACHRVWLSRCASRYARELLQLARDYTSLLRRTMACLKEYKLLGRGLESIWTIVKSTTDLVCEQQSELSLLLCRCSSALLGNLPWLQEDVSWAVVDAIPEAQLPGAVTEVDMVKIHHTFLVVQSAFLKHLAMSHFIQTARIEKAYKNHNERLYWLHTELIPYLYEQYNANYSMLDRMYRLLRNCGSSENIRVKKSSIKLKESWFYSDIHCNITRSTVELKSLLNKATKLDVFLDSCASNNTDLDLNVLDKDVDSLIEDTTRCLGNLQNAQLRLKKLRRKYKEDNDEAIQVDEKEIVDERVIKIDDSPPKIRDEVFYAHKTEDETVVNGEPSADITTGPGKIEKQASKLMLEELKRNLVKRETVMREREKIALINTMPELKGKIPEFPRQMPLLTIINGFINKIRFPKLKKEYKNAIKKKKDSFNKRIDRKLVKCDKYDPSQVLNYNITCKLMKESNLKLYRNGTVAVESNARNKNLQVLRITQSKINFPANASNTDSSSNGNDAMLSDNSFEFGSNETSSSSKAASSVLLNRNIQNGRPGFVNSRLSKSDSLSGSSDSDFDSVERRELLNDIRRHRALRRKSNPASKKECCGDADEGLSPLEYSFGANAAMASLLQGVRGPMAEEQIFMGDGELSEDSGNEN